MNRKRQDVGVVVARYSLIGTVLAALIGLIGVIFATQGKPPDAKLELTQIALAATQTAISQPVIVPQNTASPVPQSTSSPAQTTAPVLWPTQLSVVGYPPGHGAITDSLRECPNCFVAYFNTIKDLPDSWFHYSGHIGSPTRNISEGGKNDRCYSKQELLDMGATTLVGFDYVFCQVPITTTPISAITDCPSPGSASIRSEEIKPGLVVNGPATIRPNFGSPEIAKAIGLEDVDRWGINIVSGTSVTIPAKVTLMSGSVYVPDGKVFYFDSNGRINAAQQCWLTTHP